MNVMSSYRRRLMAGAYPKEMPNYLCFTALEDGTFTFAKYNLGIAYFTYIEYSIDEGATWTRLTNTNNESLSITTPTISAGGKVYWRGIANRYRLNNNWRGSFNSTANFSISGNIMSILVANECDKTTALTSNNQGAFGQIFKDINTLVSAEDLVLPATTLAEYCYYEIFANCANLATPPKELPATNILNNSYNGMFKQSGIMSVPSMPELNIESSDAMGYMFYQCTSLVIGENDRIKIRNISPSATWSLRNIFTNSNKSTYCPIDILYTGALPQGCMYYACAYTKVKYMKMLATDISASNATTNYLGWSPNSSDCIFVKNINATWVDGNSSSVPSNWTIIYYDPAVDKYYTDQTRATECDDHGNPI